MQDSMVYFATTQQTFAEACTSLQDKVQLHGYSVLKRYDFDEIFASKGIDYKPQCTIFEVCNATQAKRIMQCDMKLNMALPCRISVFTENDEIKIGMLSPRKLLDVLSHDEIAIQVATEVDASLRQVIQEAI